MARTHLIFLLLVLLSKSTSSTSTKEQEEDRIKALPGQPKVGFSQFSGYVTVNESHGRSLFYWLTESSSHSPHTKPLLLWLNGGPGCSSIAYGASEEIGPFRISKTGYNLYLNNFSWNTEANLLFLESPVGVGFSYTNTSSDFEESGDERTAQDNLIFLISWMSRFPQYQYRDFYIVGESYAGHYVPQLAKKIHEYNKDCKNPVINLKGFMVGNPEMDKNNDKRGTITYWWSHAMISDTSYNCILKNCDFTADRFSKECNTAIYDAAADFGDIDQYSIYTPKCVPPQDQTNQTKFVQIRQMQTTKPFLVDQYDPCTENYAEIYYNHPEVQRAMHANRTAIPYKWTACSDSVFDNWNWRDSDNSMLPIYKELIAAGLRIWVYSGDTDSVIPVTATRFSLSKLNLTVKTRWYPWYSGNQVGGRTEVYEGLTFVTVGNGDIDKHYDRLGSAMYAWSHAMMSDKTYKSILKHCSFTAHKNSNNCNWALYFAFIEFGKVNEYNIYSPSCVHQTNQTKFQHGRLLAEEYDPCTENYAEIYYNRPDVQRAMHANLTSIPYKWTTCNMVLNKNWKDSEFSMLPIYKELIAAGLRIWVFSGDTDAVVPVTGTRLALNKLNLPVKTRWYPWYSEKQVGGWTEVYEGLTFATVRGAGHEVPVLQPERALTLLRSFLAGKELPRSD
ncbi:Alpha/Beta hydrolase fold [Arabidopsis suecica]|uniref:Carboxypeptidase n=1 Tax=Arabidopsis suecica TaxID=45249 RepID=A0A8T2AFZ3_ARASU|nr:Alpha/Beta hydrolase fold [Arabidopsis suecica]